MRLVRNILAFCAIALLLAVHLSSADTRLRVDEKATKAVMKHTSVELSMAIENPSIKAVGARVRIEMLNHFDLVRASVERDAQFAPGSNRFNCELAIDPNLQADWSNYRESKRMLWYRFRYRIITDSPDAGSATEGIISLSEIAPDLFGLKIAGSPYALGGKPYRLVIYAGHPLKPQPAKGVNINAELKFEDEQRPLLKASGVTDDDGYAILSFDLPQGIGMRECEIRVTGGRDGQIREATEEIRIENIADITISADKPIYQPGQTIHIRALARDGFTKRPVTNQDATLKINDPEGTTVFRSSLKTSRFGIANIDWPVPESARLGMYSIEIRIEDGIYEGSRNGLGVKLSRYDLPTFAVSVKPDRSYYLAGQNAAVEVRADYLFGKPVPRGRVRVVRESEREWNYREQKWGIEEGEKYEGVTDSQGRFLARLNLRRHHAELKEESNSRYRDISFAAYVTDPATNRTEQRRFDLRLTRDAIHIYVIEGPYYQRGALSSGFYLSASYADGSPAECEIEIYPGDRSKNKPSGNSRGPMLQRVRTNSYGIAKVSNLTIPNRADTDSNAEIEFVAKDSNRLTGSYEHTFWGWFGDKTVIRVTTGKTIHRAGEPVEARIESNAKEMTCVVNLEDGHRIITSRTIRLRDGQATLTFPYSEAYAGALSVIAYANDPEGDGEDDFITGSHTILYPRDRQLKLDVESSRDTYRPGEDASIAFRVRGTEGQSVESALGVVVMDRAVEERARSDQEFGAGLSFCDAFTRYRENLAGVTLDSINKLDMSKPIPEGIDLAAEVLLNRYRAWWVHMFSGGGYDTSQRYVFSEAIELQLRPIKNALNHRFAARLECPEDAESLRRILDEEGIEFEHIKDPWGNEYRTRFYVQNTHSFLQLISAGADKRFDTTDDFYAASPVGWLYFAPQGRIINRALSRFHERTGRFIRDIHTLKSELASEGLVLDELRDKWNQPYKIEFGVYKDQFTVSFISGGPNQHFDSTRASDDFTIWTSQADYFDQDREKIGDAVGSYFDATSRFPENLTVLRHALRRSRLNFDQVRDGWGRRVYALFKTQMRYTDRVTQQTRTVYGGSTQNHTEIAPVTQRIDFIAIRSAGADGKQWTADDFDLATYSRIVAEQSSRDFEPKPSRAKGVISGRAGIIEGTVTDATGAIVAGVKVKATNQKLMKVYEAETNDEGVYVLRNLPAGRYELRFEASGFKSSIYTDVHVVALNVMVLDAVLQVGTVTETMEITAGSEETIHTETSQMSYAQISQLPLVGSSLSQKVNWDGLAQSSQISTPRLREYFPETLVWQPELETDANGQARLNFKLADNITTWKLSVVASTIDGEIATAEREIRAFQPFFVEHDPPRFLTEGDEINLPVIVRNYLDKPQTVDLEMKSESWFEMIGAAERQAKIAAGDASREVFSFRAVSPTKDGKQRVTAQAVETGDAIEKSVSVRPDGEEIIETAGQVFSDHATLEVNVPDNVIKNTPNAELKIYPNLMAHVVEGIEGIIQRPYGCAEQTISSTYPSLFLLRYYKERGGDLPKIASRAQRYAQAGYEKLLNYRSRDGGFAYWERGDADTALTAYALRFLEDASEFASIDEDVIKDAREWLFRKQQSDGRWIWVDWEGKEDLRRTAMLTALVARSLARPQANADANNRARLKLALDYLARRVEEIDEPYLIASFALAATDAEERERAEQAVKKLRAIARNESDTSYWTLETNTPFYGWGLAGRIETSALAVRAIASQSDQASNAQQSDELISRGLLFLIRQKDRYGVWYSTQATVNVLDAMMALLSQKDARRTDAGGDAEILVNGRIATTATMPPGNTLTGPITIDLSRFLAASRNRIEIRRPAGSPVASAQVVSTHYIPWNRTASDTALKLKESSLLRLQVNFDKPQAHANEEIICRVETERIGHRGYGMMLAEVGLPPGVDVDRKSLEDAINASGWTINQYDVLPDRVIVYLWPRAGGSKFQFKFRPRYGIKAQSAPSSIYDYYNPEARATVPPSKFMIR